jgi:protein-S-isoprenylcysteine O-methyltransferase Ste14
MQIFENTPLDYTPRAFAMQFEEDGDGVLYRQSQRGPAYPISSEEEAGFVRRYTVRIYAGAFVLVAAVLGMIAAVGTYTDQMASPPPDEAIVTGIVVSCIVALVAYFALSQWLWTAPARVLSRRTAVRVERTAQAAAKEKYSKISWTQLTLGGVAILLLVVKFGQKMDLTQGYGLIFSALIALGTLALIYQVVQKIRQR